MQYAIWPELFFLEFDDTYLHGDILNSPDTDRVPELLFLHDDAPDKNRSVFNSLRQVLLNKYNLSSCSFDFIGHGSTGGDWNKTCMRHRTQQITDVIDGCFDSQPLSVIAVGTGACNIIQLLDKQRIASLVFITPVLPPQELETLPFGLFSKGAGPNIQEQWLSKPSRKVLGNFKGNVSLITTTQDKTWSNWLQTKSRDNAQIGDRAYSVISIPPDQKNLMQAANQHPKILLKIAAIVDKTVAISHSQVVQAS